jgi:hypothetical protein
MCRGDQSAKTARSTGGFINAGIDAVVVKAFAQNPEGLTNSSE